MREKGYRVGSPKAVNSAVVNLEDSLRNRLGLDSLDIAELLIECEKAFDIDLGRTVDSVNAFNTVQDLVDLVFEKTQG